MPFDMFFVLIIAFQWQMTMNAQCEYTSSIQENPLGARFTCLVVCSHSFWFCPASSCALASHFNHNSGADWSRIKAAAIPCRNKLPDMLQLHMHWVSNASVAQPNLEPETPLTITAVIQKRVVRRVLIQTACDHYRWLHYVVSAGILRKH